MPKVGHRRSSIQSGSPCPNTLVYLQIARVERVSFRSGRMSTPSNSHRPRKKRKQLVRSATITDIVKINAEDHASLQFPLVAFLWPARGTTSQWVLLPLILMVAAVFRWSVGLWGHSGFQQLPIHGDFEAQRHWMEITTHLPVSMWYFYDLEYWGLDYPPLTAYHSWLCGKV